MMLLSDALQKALFERLSLDAPLAALIGAHVYDSAPTGPPPPLYVLLGDEAVRDASDKLAAGAVHEVSFAVISTQESFLRLKEAAAAVVRALDAPGWTLERGRLSALWFLGATAKRGSGGQRRIDLKFRARLEG